MLIKIEIRASVTHCADCHFLSRSRDCKAREINWCKAFLKHVAVDYRDETKRLPECLRAEKG